MIPEPFNSLISIILMILIGLFLSKRNWFSEESTNMITRLILDVSIPLSIVYCVLGNINKNTLFKMGAGVFVPFISIGIEYVISFVIASAVRMGNDKKGLFVSMFSNPNTLFIGIPVNLAVFGTASLPYAYIYYIVSTLFFNTIGIITLSKNQCEHADIKSIEKNLITPILISFVFTMFALFSGLNLPNFLMKVCDTIGSLSTPLSLLFIGICLSQIPLKTLRVSWAVFGVILGRFIISPIITVVIGRLLHTPQLALNVFVLQSFLPAMTSTPMFGKRYGCDTQYATIGTAITALLSLIVIPLYSSFLF